MSNALRTEGVKQLVVEVLTSLPRPYSEDVIDDVLHAIEQRSDWLTRYDDLCAELTKTVVNNWCGVWTERLLGGTGFRQVPAKANTLSESYSKLALDGSKPIQKVTPSGSPKSRGITPVRKTPHTVTEEAAKQMMADYFQKHKSTLPLSVRKQRDRILELLMTGLSAEEAFSKAMTQ